jgi:trypsin
MRTAIAFTLLAACAIEPGPEPGESVTGDDNAVIAGVEALPGQFPYQVSIQFQAIPGLSKCGGTLIGDRTVLTAAHCVRPQLESDTLSDLVVVGNVTSLSAGGETFGIRSATMHESYNVTPDDSDIALITLDRSARHLGTVALLSARSETLLAYNGAYATVSGWGETLFDAESDSLLWTITPVISTQACRTLGYAPGRITDNMVCSGVPFIGGASACHGDSGGPLLVLQLDGRPVQLGVVSFSFGCGQPNFPGVSTRVPLFQDWISARVPDVKFI